MFHTTGPSRIIFVRHGQREDHADERWRLTTSRPHDAPLTLVGKQAAFELGVYLSKRGVVPVVAWSTRNGESEGAASEGSNVWSEHISLAHGAERETAAATMSTSDGNSPTFPLGCKRQRGEDEEFSCDGNDFLTSSWCDNIVILSSPLIRTIQTSHHIACGIMAGNMASSSSSSSLFEQKRTSGVTMDGAAREGCREEGADTSECTTTTNTTKAGEECGNSSERYTPSVEGFSDTLYPSSLEGLLASYSSSSSSSSLPFTVAAAAAPNNTKHNNSNSNNTVAAIPIFLEPGVMEGQYWMNHDIKHAEELGNTMIPSSGLAPMGTSTLRALSMRSYLKENKEPLSRKGEGGESKKGAVGDAAADDDALTIVPPPTPCIFHPHAESLMCKNLKKRSPRDEAALHPRPLDSKSAAIVASNPVFMPSAYHRAFVSALVQPFAFPHSSTSQLTSPRKDNNNYYCGFSSSLRSPPSLTVTPTTPTAANNTPIIKASAHKSNNNNNTKTRGGEVAVVPPSVDFGFSCVEYGYDHTNGRIVELDVYEGGKYGGGGAETNKDDTGGTLPSVHGSNSNTTSATVTTAPRRLRRGNDVQLRCYETAASIANCRELHNKIVIVVGHGQTVKDSAQRLVPKVLMADRPKYTAFCDLVRHEAPVAVALSPVSPLPASLLTSSSIRKPTFAPPPQLQHQQQSMYDEDANDDDNSNGLRIMNEESAEPVRRKMTTAPLAAGVLSPKNDEEGQEGRVRCEEEGGGGMSPTHCFSLREGSSAFDVPHLPASLLREY